MASLTESTCWRALCSDSPGAGMRAAASEVWHSSTASLHVCEVKSTCFVAALHAGKQAVLSLNGFYRAITGWLGPATPRRYALATSQQHISVVEPPRGASRSVGGRRTDTGFASRRSHRQRRLLCGTLSGPGSCEQTCIACSTVPRRARTARCPRGKAPTERSRMHALWDLSQPRAGHFVHLPHVPCSEVLSRPCYEIIAHAMAEGSPITRRDAAW